MSMTNLIAMPLVLPILMAVLLIFLRNYRYVQRVLVVVTLLVMIGMSIVLLQHVHTDGILRLDFGGWQPPFGILFVADPFAVLLVLIATIVTLFCMVYAFSSFSARYERMFAYPLMLLMLAGVNGSFLTGDIFNLFVCFEVMLLASYALIALGGRTEQLRESLKYVITNIIASWLFLVAIAFLYSTIGTLNMAHIAQRVQEVGPDPLITTIALFFLIVFALKGGLLLFFWLPGSYSVPPVPIAAMFGALLTKVGMYAIIRTFTLMFTTQPEITHQLITIMAIITLIAGSLGALAYRDIRQIAAFNVIIGVGFVLLALGANNEAAYAGAIYYMMHDMVGKAMLFLICGTMIYLTKQERYDDMSGLIRHYPLFGWMFLVVMVSLTGMPPFSGFVGKVMMGEGLVASGSYVSLAIGFGASVIILYSLLRVMLHAIFGETMIADENKVKLPKPMLLSIVALGAVSLYLGTSAEMVLPYVTDAARVLADPSIYIEAILGK